MSTEITVFGFDDISKMAGAIAESKLFGMSKQQALAMMLLAQAEGNHPAIIVRDYHMIEMGGTVRPTLKADAMVARFLQAGGRIQWHILSDKEAEATFSHAQGGEIRLMWTIEMAAKAGLAKNAMWGKYPRSMLRSRLVSEGIRTIYPGVLCGLYTPEEIESTHSDSVVHKQREAQAVERIDDVSELRAAIIESIRDAGIDKFEFSRRQDNDFGVGWGYRIEDLKAVANRISESAKNGDLSEIYMQTEVGGTDGTI